MVRMKKEAKDLCSHYVESCKITLVDGAATKRGCEEALIHGIPERNEYCTGEKRTGGAPICIVRCLIGEGWMEKLSRTHNRQRDSRDILTERATGMALNLEEIQMQTA